MKPKFKTKWHGDRLVPVAVENGGPELRIVRDLVHGREQIVIVVDDDRLIYRDPHYEPCGAI